jgi:hypothetical protein
MGRVERKAVILGKKRENVGKHSRENERERYGSLGFSYPIVYQTLALSFFLVFLIQCKRGEIKGQDI